jgi:hypothetical protein
LRKANTATATCATLLTNPLRVLAVRSTGVFKRQQTTGNWRLLLSFAHTQHHTVGARFEKCPPCLFSRAGPREGQATEALVWTDRQRSQARSQRALRWFPAFRLRLLLPTGTALELVDLLLLLLLLLDPLVAAVVVASRTPA